MNIESIADDLAVLSDSIASVLSKECDRLAVHAFFDQQDGLDIKLWSLAAEQGWLGIGLPEEVGGLGFGAHGLDVLYRQLGRVMAPGAFIPTLATAQWLSEIGNDRIVSSLLPSVISGECTFAAPLSLVDAPLSLDQGRISGDTGLMLGSIDASIAIVPVLDGGAASYALIETAAGKARFTPANIWDKTRHVGRYSFSGAEPLDLIADSGGNLGKTLRRYLALAVAGDSVGSARALTEQTVTYLKERVQFGRPLASFQALKHRCADLMTAVIHAEEMLDQAVYAVADGEPSANMWANLAKAAADEKYKFIAQDCLQLWGGVGFTWEYDCHIFLKRSLLNRDIAGSANKLRDLALEDFTEATLAGRTTAELKL